MDQYPSRTSRIFKWERTRVPAQVGQALEQLASLWGASAARWLIGGSVGLLLQGVELDTEPRDLDVYADEADAVALHPLAQTYATDRQQYSETPIYRSLLSHYAIADVAVELVGRFDVETAGSSYTTSVRHLLWPHAWSADINGTLVRFMPLAHELVFNVLRERPDRYEPIAACMRTEWQRHEEPLQTVLCANSIAPRHRQQLQRLLGHSLEREE